MNKKKMLALCICIAMLAIALIGGTMAYFTDDKEQTNTFTAGNVGITLDEAVVKEDGNGNLIATEDRTSAAQTYRLYPAQKITKDPTITVASPSEATYVAAKITVTDGEGDIQKIIGMNYKNLIDVTKILEGGYVQTGLKPSAEYKGLPVYGDNTYTLYQTIESEGTYVFYLFVEDAKKAGDKIVLFDTLKIDSEWDNEEMAELKELKIDVKAYAVQQHGFSKCIDAMKAAFATDFSYFN